MASILDSIFGAARGGSSSLLSPSAAVSDFANPTANLSNVLSPTTSLSDILSPRTNLSGQFLSPTTDIRDAQLGALNLKGTLAIGDTKKALVYAPIYNISSPNSRVSSSPQVEQAGGSSSPFDFLQTPTNLLILGGVGIAAVLILGGSKKK